jgi:hypothetical protein
MVVAKETEILHPFQIRKEAAPTNFEWANV